MTSPTITVTPSTPSANFEAETEVTFSYVPLEPVTITVWNETVDPPVIVHSRSFTADPYKMTFVPLVVGIHRVNVTWRNGLESEDLGFDVI